MTNYKLAHNPHYLNNIKSCTYHCMHEIFNNIIKHDSLHCVQVREIKFKFI